MRNLDASLFVMLQLHFLQCVNVQMARLRARAQQESSRANTCVATQARLSTCRRMYVLPFSCMRVLPLSQILFPWGVYTCAHTHARMCMEEEMHGEHAAVDTGRGRKQRGARQGSCSSTHASACWCRCTLDLHVGACMGARLMRHASCRMSGACDMSDA